MMHELELGLDTFGDVTIDAAGRRKSGAEVIRDVVERGACWPTRWASTSSASASTTATTSPCPPPRWCWPPSPPAPSASGSARPSPCSAPTTPCGCSSASPRSTPCRTAGPRSSSGVARSPSRSRCSATTSSDYEELFEEKLDLFADLRHEAPVTWQGRTRAPLDRPAGVPDHRVRRPDDVGRRRRQPRVGGAGRPLRAAADARHHRRRPAPASARSSTCTTGRSAELGSPRLPVGVHSPGHVAATDEEAREQLCPHFKAMRDRIGAERGWGPMTPASSSRAPDPAARSTSARPRPSPARSRPRRRRSACDRFDLKYSHGPLPHERDAAQHRALRHRGHPPGA